MSTPARRIKSWAKRLKGATLLSIDGTTITTTDTAKQTIRHAIKNKAKQITLTVSPNEQSPIHPEEGVPMLYFDQLATIHDHLQSIKTSISQSSEPTINKINKSEDKYLKYVLRMINSYLQYGTINAAKAILSKNKRRGHRLARNKLRKQSDWNE